MHFIVRHSGKLATRCFQHTIKENIIFKKDLYSKSGFDAKPIFQREFVKFGETLFSTQELYFMTGFNAKPISQEELVEILKNAFLNPHWRKTVF